MGSSRYPDVTLAVLRGGRGSRLGGIDKSALRVEGRSCLERLMDLAPLFAETLLVGGGPVAGTRLIADLIADRGAPGGVHAALVQAGTPWVLAVAGDMPFVTAEVMSVLLAAREEALDAICFERDGRLEPLLGAYRAEAATRWDAALASSPSFAQIYAALRTRVLSENAWRAVDPIGRALVSLNTPEDVARWSAAAANR